MTRIALFAAAMFVTGLAAANEKSSADKIRMMDTNGDGKLSSAEHSSGASKMFTEMDTNRDGSVTSMEMDAAHKMMMNKDGKTMSEDSWNKNDKSRSAKPATKPAKPATDDGG